MSAAMLTEVAAGTSRECHLVEFQFDSGTLYYTDSGYDQPWGGNTYIAEGNLLAIGPIKESLDLLVKKTTVTLSGANSANITTALTEAFVNRVAIIRKAKFDSNFDIVPSPVVLFSGFISGRKLPENPETGKSTVEWSLSNHWEDFDRVNGRRTNHNSHQLRYPADTFFQHAEFATDAIEWGGLPDIPFFNFDRLNSGVDEELFLRFRENFRLKNAIKISKRGNDKAIPVFYGTRPTPGTRTFKASSGANKEYLDIVFTLAEGECDSLVETWINDKLSTDSIYSGLVTITFHSGAPGQTVDAGLQTAQGSTIWPNTSTGDDTCYVVVRLLWTAAGPFKGEPTFRFILKGKKCLEKIGETTVYTESPAWHIYDYLINTRYGKGIPEAEILEQSFIDSANFYATQTAECAGANHDLIAGGEVVETDVTIVDNVKGLVFGARSWLTHSENKLKLIPNQDVASSFTITTNDIKDKWKHDDTGKQGKLNRIEVSYIRPGANNEYKSDMYALDEATLRTNEDDGKLLEGQFDYPTIDNECRAARYAEFELEKSRDNISGTIKCKQTTLGIEVGDVIGITHESPSWTAELFRVFDLMITNESIVFKLKEHDATNYTITAVSDPVDPPATTLPDVFNVTPHTVFGVASGDAQLLLGPDGTIVERALLTWTKSTDPFLAQTEVQWKKSADSIYESIFLSNENQVQHFINSLTDNALYDFRIAAINSVGRRSTWAPVTNHLFLGKAAPPPDVSQFLVAAQPDGTREFTWTYATPPADLAGFIVRSALGTGLAWAALADIPGLEKLTPGVRLFESNQLASGSYTFGIKAVDTSGNESTNAQLIDITLPDPRILETIAFVDLFADGWSGTKTTCFVPRDLGTLVATSQDDWADETIWSGWTGWNSNPNLTVIYSHGSIDAGAVVSFTPLVTIVHNGDTITIEERHSPDDSTWTSWAAVGPLITDRYIEIRFTITKTSGVIEVTAGKIRLSGTPLSEIIEDLVTSTVSSPAGDLRLPITKTYTIIRHVFVTIQGTGGGWTWKLIDKNVASGPRVQIFNSSATLADATIDAQVIGV